MDGRLLTADEWDKSNDIPRLKKSVREVLVVAASARTMRSLTGYV
jgi:hypothetical protein